MGNYSVYCEYVRTWNNGDSGGCESSIGHIGDYVKLSDAKAEIETLRNRGELEEANIIDNETGRVKLTWNCVHGWY